MIVLKEEKKSAFFLILWNTYDVFDDKAIFCFTSYRKYFVGIQFPCYDNIANCLDTLDCLCTF